jgi:hypothetical protein
MWDCDGEWVESPDYEEICRTWDQYVPDLPGRTQAIYPVTHGPGCKGHRRWLTEYELDMIRSDRAPMLFYPAHGSNIQIQLTIDGEPVL